MSSSPAANPDFFKDEGVLIAGVPLQRNLDENSDVQLRREVNALFAALESTLKGIDCPGKTADDAKNCHSQVRARLASPEVLEDQLNLIRSQLRAGGIVTAFGQAASIVTSYPRHSLQGQAWRTFCGGIIRRCGLMSNSFEDSGKAVALSKTPMQWFAEFKTVLTQRGVLQNEVKGIVDSIEQYLKEAERAGELVLPAEHAWMRMAYEIAITLHRFLTIGTPERDAFATFGEMLAWHVPDAQWKKTW